MENTGLKPSQVNADLISVFLLTRGQIEYLERFFQSLEDTTSDKKNVDIWIYLDEDDSESIAFAGSLQAKPNSFSTNFVIGPKMASMGEMHNILRKNCKTTPGIVIFTSNKLVFIEYGWDEIIRTELRRLPDRMWFTHPIDPYHGAFFGAVLILTAEWMNHFDRALTHLFPFGFDDTWINQVAMMVGRRKCLPIIMGLQMKDGRGKASRMRNMIFWRRFFEETLDERWQEAESLRRALFPEDSSEFQASFLEGEKWKNRFFNDRQPLEFIQYEQRKLSSAPSPDPESNRRFFRVEKRALALLGRKMLAKLEADRFEDALRILQVMQLAETRLSDLDSISPLLHGRNKEDSLGLIRLFLDSCGNEEALPQVKIVFVQPSDNPLPSGIFPIMRERYSRIFYRSFLKRYSKFLILQTVAGYSGIFKNLFAPIPYTPDGFPFLWENFYLLLGLVRNVVKGIFTPLPHRKK